MFRRRKSSSHHRHPLSASNSQSAHSAASHAFLKSQPSSSSLSSAAAATALRNRTPTPTIVENVETKRMVQRRSSSSSQPLASPSLLRPASRQDLRRTRSSGSMTTRTFRDQSPHRPSSTTLPRRATPPIPSIPSEYTSRSQPNGRSYSMGPTVRPPSPVVDTWRGMSVDRGRRGSSNAVPELQRPESRASINFSYPMNSRPTSPTDPPPATTYERRDAAFGTSLAAQLSSAPYPQSQQIARQSVNTSPRGMAKERLVSPGRGTTPVGGTAIAAAQAAIVPRNDEHTSLGPMVRGKAPPAERGAWISQSKRATVPDRKPCPYSGPTLSPPTVPEDRREEEHNPVGDMGDQMSTPPRVGLMSPEPPGDEKLPETPERRQHSGLSALSPPESHRSAIPAHPISPPTSQPTSSPERLTRFSDHLLIGGLATEDLHRPPPRSVSPVKSAMKDPRKNAFSPDGISGATTRPGPGTSEGSDGTSVASDEGVRAGIIRRKPVKVSFDDEAEIMGVAASPPTSPEDVCPDSPGRSNLKTGWFGANRRKTGTSALADEFTEMLKPRRALPSFGSVRRDREGDQYTGPPVHEESDNESTSSSELDEVRDISSAPSVWGILPNTPMQPLRQTQLNRVPSPVPEDASEPPTNPSPPKENNRAAHADEARVPAGQATTNGHPKPPRTPQSGLDIPGIAVQPATPEFTKERASLEWYDVPGGFPRTSVEMDRGRHNNPRRSLEKSVTFPSEGAESDDESGESVYSDAEETFDGDGFGSINAIVDTCRPQHRPEGPTDRSPPRQQPEDVPEVPEPCRIARVVTPAEGANVLRSISPDSPHRLRPFSSPYPPFPTQPSGKVQPTPGAETTTGPPRRSMSADARRHADSDASMQPTARQLAGPRGRGRPVSWGPVSLVGPAGRDQMYSPLQRVPSDGSDSSSSFKRSRRTTRSPHHTMRRTLRGSPSAETPSTPKRQTPMSLSHRSSSLTRPTSSGSISGSGTLRATLRGQPPRREKRSLFSKGKLPKVRNTKPSGVPFTSRFADSDSDTGGPAYPRLGRKFSRQFDDNEDRGTDDLRPVRGIPRLFDDGESTELEDSSDNESRVARPQKPRAVANETADPSASRQPALAAVAKSRGMTESQLEEFLRQPVSGRKPSLLHRLSIRKSKSPARGLQSSVDAPSIPESAPVGGVITTITANDGVVSPTPRLLKKGSSKSATDEGAGNGWPLRAPPVDAGGSPSTNGRPQTADGTVGTAPALGLGLGPGPAASHALDVGFSRGRKRRFPRLRRAFGL
ncbi:hypothetical protein BDW42DRAFT_47288 [Aspergillus taichungensis]|uniref:Uncharacterized protein n=1 Tax=Aspergillus taichungensis TaxID=482145 RepID=A0A2J5HDQ8_9EURO|nr:hypothetical protein BDW42DRAFT_47288 [Aspergillus taichungensis]